MERRGEKMKIKRHQQLCNHLIKLSQAAFMLLFFSTHLLVLCLARLAKGKVTFRSRLHLAYERKRD